MKAVLLDKITEGKDISLSEIPIPAIRPGWVLVKVKADRTEKQQIIAVADVFRAKIVDVSADSLMIELTGNINKVEAFLKLLEGFEILSIVRTGLTGLLRGTMSDK